MKKNVELFKSLILGALAFLLLWIWLQVQPKPTVELPREKIGRKLFENFDDPLKIRSLEIIRLDSISGKKKSILLTERKGHWFIASHFNYPAENTKQMAKVVSPFLTLAVLSIAGGEKKSWDLSKITDLHRECKVLDPSDLSPEQKESSGILVRINGGDGEHFVEAILGDRVPESSSVRDVRYIRRPGEDEVYTVDFSTASSEEAEAEESQTMPERLSINPIDWMNRDLLQISRWNIKELAVHQYSYDVKSNGIKPEGYYAFKQDPSMALERVWTPTKGLVLEKKGSKYIPIIDFDKKKPNNKQINEIADTIGHLTIAEVERKTDRWSHLLEESRSIREMINSNENLAAQGFYIASFDLVHPMETEPILIGEQGEISLLMKDGILIRLVFGKEIEGKVYLFLTADFNPDFPKEPTLLPLKKISDKALTEEKKILEKENVRIESENALRRQEHQLTIAEGHRKATDLNRRFADWFYLIDKKDFEIIKPSGLKIH